MIPINGLPKSECVIKLEKGSVCAFYDANGCLRLIRGIKMGKKVSAVIPDDETVLEIEDFKNSVANFKSAGAHSGFYSMQGEIFWSSIWEDAGPIVVKKASFQEWVDECARVLAGDQEKIQE